MWLKSSTSLAWCSSSGYYEITCGIAFIFSFAALLFPCFNLYISLLMFLFISNFLSGRLSQANQRQQQTLTKAKLQAKQQQATRNLRRMEPSKGALCHSSRKYEPARCTPKWDRTLFYKLSAAALTEPGLQPDAAKRGEEWTWRSDCVAV